MYTYILELWNPLTNKYDEAWKGSYLHQAEVMFDKPYNKTRTRRLLRIQTEVLYKEKAGQLRKTIVL